MLVGFCMVLCMVACGSGQVVDILGTYGLRGGLIPFPSFVSPFTTSAGFTYGLFSSYVDARGNEQSAQGQTTAQAIVNDNSSSVRLSWDQRSGFRGPGNSTIAVQSRGVSGFPHNNLAVFDIFGLDTRSSSQNGSSITSSIVSDATAVTRPGVSATNATVCVGPYCTP